MKFIPLLLIVVGGVMIMAGIQGDNPLTVIKSVLTNTPLTPSGGGPPSNIGGGPAPNPNPAPKPGG